MKKTPSSKTAEQIAEEIINEIESELILEDAASTQQDNVSATKGDGEKTPVVKADGDSEGDTLSGEDAESKLKSNVSKKSVSAEKTPSKEVMSEEDEDGDEEMPDDETKSDTEVLKKKIDESLSSDQMVASISEHVSKLINSRTDILTEEQKEHTSTIFESAVKDRANAVAAILIKESADLIEKRTTNIQEAYDAKYDTLVDHVDAYLGYAIQEWMTENTVAIESSLRTELTEEFISRLKDVFVESYIDIPEEKYNVLAEQDSEITRLRTQLNEEITKNVQIAQELTESKRIVEFNTLTESLTSTERERLETMLEGVPYDTKYAGKVKTLLESYFVDQPDTTAKESGVMLNEERTSSKPSPEPGSLLDAMMRIAPVRK